MSNVPSTFFRIESRLSGIAELDQLSPNFTPRIVCLRDAVERNVNLELGNSFRRRVACLFDSQCEMHAGGDHHQ